jgi:NADPH:quinone reductase-like Zn-dependent oxidoreductase
MAEHRPIRVLLCDKLGNPADTSSHAPLKVVERPAPTAMQPNSVRIKVLAAALNYADALLIQVANVRNVTMDVTPPLCFLCLAV